MRCLVVIPCRDEAAVVRRKLANLARCTWPVSAAPHRIVVVDDGSRDDTDGLARSASAELFAGRTDVEVLVVANDVRPGKPGAVRTGLGHGAQGVDLVVLTDADVVCLPDAIVALAAAFEREPRLALACASQRFVEDLATDGACVAQAGGHVRGAGGTFDACTARVRQLESRAGVLFSVHGQLAAWRADLGLAPSFGVAADDIDLRFQVKLRTSEPRRVELVGDAVFFEVKTPDGPARREQRLRRARAWFQIVQRGPIPARGFLERAQTLLYRVGPRAAPVASLVAIPLTAVVLAASGFVPAAFVVVGLALALAASPIGRRWIDLARTIHAAARRERASPLSERWETSRP